MDRTPLNGRPFYCKACGLGFDEYMACESPACDLESNTDARLREHAFHAFPDRGNTLTFMHFQRDHRAAWTIFSTDWSQYVSEND